MSVAVVLMAYGSPDRLADVPAYYADIRGGRPVAPERLEELLERYRRLGINGGESPLNVVTEATRASLERELGVPVHTGMKHWHPRIGEAADRALERGAKTIVGLVLAPHFSPLSVGGYRRQLEAALRARAELVFVERWGDDEAFVELLADRVRSADAHVVFTAHSLPVRGSGDYEHELLETSRLIAERAGLREWSFSFQSESATGEQWLRPDILDHLGELAGRGVRRVRVCPIGFVADHLEIRWDLDVEATDRARALGIEFSRIEMPNADASFIAVLAGVVRRALAVPSRA